METSILQWKEEASIRMQMVDGEPWFAAKDLCELLGLDNSRQAVSRLDDDEKGVISSDTLGGKQELTFVSESGMYALIFQSRKPQARAFRKWVTGEVLPSLRKYGYYVAPGAQLTDEQREELERVMMGRMRRYLSRRDYIQVARRTGYPVWFVQRVVAGQAGGHAGSVMLALQERALKNCREYVNPLSEARMTSVIEQLNGNEKRRDGN